MEKELNIAAILKDKPQNTRLWSPIFGDVYLKDVTDVNNNMIRITHHGVDNIFMNNGKVWADGDVCLFPSRWIDDWQKFAWKKGDVLVSNDSESHIIFNGFSKDNYTTFEGKHWICVSKKRYISHLYAQNTQGYHIEDDKDAAQTYINTIEERFCGKLNLETLEIEKQPKQEFKDGDIVVVDKNKEMNLAKIIAIYNDGDILLGFNSYAYLNVSLEKLNFCSEVLVCGRTPRLASEEENQQLFDALAKEGKRWNPDTKLLEDLPKKCEFKPMDWCLMKDSTKYWELCQFAYTRKVHGTTIYSAVGGLIYYKCIPYNDQTKHLLGTTDEWKGGE